MRTLLHLCCSKCCEPSTLHPWKVMSHSQKWLYVHTWLIHTFSRACNLYVSVTCETWLYDAYMTHLHLKALCDGLGAYRMGDCMWHTRETWLYETWYIPFDMMCSCESWLIHILSSCGLGMVHMGYGMGCLYASHTWDMSLWCIWGTCMCRTYKIWIYETRLIQHDMTRELVRIFRNCALRVAHIGWVTCMCHTYETWIYEIQHKTTRSCETWLIHIFSKCALRVAHLG